MTGGSKDCIGYRKVQGVSMNIGTRIENIRKIVKENSNTYHRLIKVKSNMDASKMREENKVRQRLRKMIQGNGMNSQSQPYLA